jgi:hypothetical protein
MLGIPWPIYWTVAHQNSCPSMLQGCWGRGCMVLVCKGIHKRRHYCERNSQPDLVLAAKMHNIPPCATRRDLGHYWTVAHQNLCPSMPQVAGVGACACVRQHSQTATLSRTQQPAADLVLAANMHILILNMPPCPNNILICPNVRQYIHKQRDAVAVARVRFGAAWHL